MVRITELSGSFEVVSETASLRLRDKSKAIKVGQMLAIAEEARTGREARIVLSTREPSWQSATPSAQG